MASRDPSSDSDYSNGGRYSIRGGHITQGVSAKVENLASTLQDTNRNLRAMDKMLEEYKEIGDQQSSKIDKLHEDYLKTSERVKEEKARRDYSRSLKTSDLDDDHARGKARHRRQIPTSPLKDYRQHAASDHEDVLYDDDRHSHRRSSRSGSGVRFFDDMDTHQIHQSIRDISSGQLRLEDDLDKEIDRRNRWESKQHKTFQEVTESLKKPDQVMDNVDRRLQNIQMELNTERNQLKKKHDEVGKISSELKRALDCQKDVPTSTVSDDTLLQLRGRLSQTESQRNMLQSDMEKIRRRLDQSEGGRQALVGQIEELKKQLLKSDEEKQQLKSRMEKNDEEFRERRRRLAYEERDREQQDQERHRLEKEVRELRAQLSKSASVVGDFGEIRRELDKSERQRVQLSDHIDVLNKDMEQKEKQTARVITQLQSMTEKCEETSQQRKQLLSQLEDTLSKLQAKTRESEGLVKELGNTQRLLHDSESRKEEIKARAQETVRQWKIKCKKLERDLDRYKHSTEQATTRCEQLIKELELTKTHSHTALQQLDHIKREFSELLAIRAQQDEQVRLKDIEVNELKSFKMDMEKDLRDCKMVIERLEYELHSAKEKTGTVLEEKIKLEDHLTAMENVQHIGQSQIQQLQREMRETSQMKVELSARLAEIANERQEVKVALSESRKSELAAREEIDKLIRRINEEKEFYMAKMENMKAELDVMKGQESQHVQGVVRHYKKDKAETEAELQALKIELQEERMSVKIFKKQQEKLKQEVDRLNKKLGDNEEENSLLQQQYYHVREEFISKSQMTEDGLSRAKEVELELLDTKEAVRKKEKDFENLFHTVAAEVDGLVEVAALDSVETYKALSLTKALASEPQKCLAEIKSKIDWLKHEFRERIDKEQWMKTNMKDAVLNSERDRHFLITELERQNDVLDQLSASRPIENSDKPERDVEEENLKFTESDVLQDFDTQNDSEHSSPESLNGSLIQEAKREREKIHERFARLQETMSTLKQELTDTHLYNQLIMKTANSETGTKSPSDKYSLRKVTFEDSTHSHSNHTPPPRSPGNSHYRNATPPRSPGNSHHRNLAKTPPPLTLTDEEFASRFLPKTPPGVDYTDHCDMKL